MTEQQRDIWAGVLLLALLLGGLLVLWLTGNWGPREVVDARRPRTVAAAGVPQDWRGLPGARGPGGPRLWASAWGA